MEIEQTIPRHAGLGSGTQLGMAVSSALATLEGDEQADAATLALRVSRGERSAVGVHGFGQGGLIVESGQRQPGTLGTLAARAEFPAAWRVVLVTPDSESGLSGSAERDAFAHLAPMPEATTDRLCRIALTELLPAVIEADVAACGSAIYEYGKTVGTYFAPAQGGTFADPQMSALVGKLRRQGIHGVGQSSWGPTIFILCGTQVEADSLVSDLNQPGDLGNCTIRITAPLNRGATVHIE
jgi:beta-RFAP synthase